MTTQTNPFRKAFTASHRRLADWIVESLVRDPKGDYWYMESGARLPLSGRDATDDEVRTLISKLFRVPVFDLSISKDTNIISISNKNAVGVGIGGKIPSYWRIRLLPGNLKAAQRQPNGFRSGFHRERVIFRIDTEEDAGGDICEDVYAMFPDIPEDDGSVLGYTHIGQHSSYDLDGNIDRSRSATPEEYADLKRELEQRGYNLDVIEPDRMPNGFRQAFSYPHSSFNDYQVEELGSDGRTTIGWWRIKLDIEKEVQHGWIPSSKVRMALKAAKILPQVDLSVLDRYVHIRPVMGQDRTYVATSWMTGREATYRISPYQGSSWSKKRKPNGFRRSISQIVPRNIRGWKRDKTIVASPLYEVYTVPHPTLPGWKIAFIKVAPGVGKIFGNVWSYAGGMVDPIYGLSGMHRFGTPDEALNYIDAQIASQTTWRKPNGFRAAIEGQTEDHDPGLLRWNLQLPNDSWTHVFLPKNPTAAQIATALGRDPRDVYDVRKKSTGSILTVEFDDGDLFTMNRVW